MFFHISPDTQFRLPIHWQTVSRMRRRQNHQLREALLLPVEGFLNHLLHNRNSRGTADKSNIMNIALAIPTPQTVFSTIKEKSMPSKKESISFIACVEEDRVRLGTFKIPFASMSKVTSTWGTPRGVGGIRSRWNFPKGIVVLSHRMVPFEGLDENTRLVVSVQRERPTLLREKSGVAFNELCHDITC